jgi:hypothetical protein
MREYENLIGQRFGKLTVKELLPSDGKGHRRWNCLCYCGNMHIATTGNLKNGHVNNCGCGKSPDLSGKVFGKLTALGRAAEKQCKGGQTYPIWICRCECGEIVHRMSNTLTAKKERMCLHCLHKASAESMTQAAGFVDGTQLSKIQDMKVSAANTSGTRGVYWHKKQNKWYARLKFQGKQMYLGTFSSYEEAVKARQNAEEDIYGNFLAQMGASVANRLPDSLGVPGVGHIETRVDVR